MVYVFHNIDRFVKRGERGMASAKNYRKLFVLKRIEIRQRRMSYIAIAQTWNRFDRIIVMLKSDRKWIVRSENFVVDQNSNL